ncbi:hypothetical protein PHYSODRAFT_324087 [Phytophthora sojae]|uniref:Uncharacterized protein n=1 Tax=Phytophthora sojae (strain P6497) TaxID=1094619 RepID=G4Z0T8_PHYSP|nr:hypothetical protein PHYSODRAFT_324087 [Phytophthora sojae]EGZ22777.1 hypothetical protein PHYSODRAFT_324087 [Phytophthora sojae]|eukprot:XP_009518065.1 hypothetical protein PHYSODRAFT_324087 [Phytophthora sojae]
MSSPQKKTDAAAEEKSSAGIETLSIPQYRERHKAKRDALAAKAAAGTTQPEIVLEGSSVVNDAVDFEDDYVEMRQNMLFGRSGNMRNDGDFVWDRSICRYHFGDWHKTVKGVQLSLSIPHGAFSDPNALWRDKWSSRLVAITGTFGSQRAPLDFIQVASGLATMYATSLGWLSSGYTNSMYRMVVADGSTPKNDVGTTNNLNSTNYV